MSDQTPSSDSASRFAIREVTLPTSEAGAACGPAAASGDAPSTFHPGEGASCDAPSTFVPGEGASCDT
jgi:hypothetical protein